MVNKNIKTHKGYKPDDLKMSIVEINKLLNEKIIIKLKNFILKI